MSATLTMTRGLPASGKSTWASAYVLEQPVGAVVRITKDALRAMLHAGRFVEQLTEPQVLVARDCLVETFLGLGVDVIVDDTNLAAQHETRLRALAAASGAEFVIRDFTDVPLEECLARDAQRGATQVGEAVIREMHARYLA